MKVGNYAVNGFNLFELYLLGWTAFKFFISYSDSQCQK